MPPSPGTKPLKELKPGDGLYGVYRDESACSADAPWAIKNLQTGDVGGRCHPTRDAANQQLRALYANMGKDAIFKGAEVDRAFQQECSTCGRTKPDGAFRPDGRFKSNLSPVCWECEGLSKMSDDGREFADSFTDKPWNGDASRFTDEQYQRSCLIDRGGDAPAKERCSLPVREPDGTVNRNALRAVASVLGGGRGGVKNASQDQLDSAKTKLRSLMKAAGIDSQMSEREFLDTVELRGVDVMAIGGPYHGTGSPAEGDNFSSDDLELIARNSNELADEVHAPVKVGHNRAQRLLRNSGLFTDEMPAAGWVTNYRVEGGRLLCDIKDIPRKLAALVPHGFRKRSVELSRVTSQSRGGKAYDPVITGLALLGAKSPAIRKLTDIKNLDDVLAWYALDHAPSRAATDGVEVEPTLRVFAEEPPELDIGAIADAVRERLGESPDTKAVSDASAKQQKGFSDEQVKALAKIFEIEEDDDAKRREAVVSKLAEAVEGGDAAADATAKSNADPAKPKPDSANADAAEPVTQAEFAARMTAALDVREQRRMAAANVDAAIECAVLDPAERDDWLKLFEENYDSSLAVLTKLAERGPRRELRALGADGKDDRLKKGRETFEGFYDQYAKMTGVPRIPAGNGAAA